MSEAALPVLTYHSFDTSGSVVSTDPGRFTDTLQALADAGYRTVDLESWVAAGRPYVDRAFAITIDDGLRSILDVADAIASRGFTATVFVVSNRVGKDNAWAGQPGSIPRQALLSWKEIEELLTLGFTCGSHGRSHVALTACDAPSLEEELKVSREEIEQALGRPCRLFAYPYGATGVAVRAVVARHYIGAFNTRLDLARSNQPAESLGRIDAYYLRSDDVRARLISGNLARWLRYRRSLRAARAAACRIRASIKLPVLRARGPVPDNVGPSRRCSATDANHVSLFNGLKTF